MKKTIGIVNLLFPLLSFPNAVIKGTAWFMR